MELGAKARVYSPMTLNLLWQCMGNFGAKLLLNKSPILNSKKQGVGPIRRVFLLQVDSVISQQELTVPDC
jgi:hypothetical protein